jgi:hypothetical protein
VTPPRLRLRLVDPPTPVPEDSPAAQPDWRVLPTDAAPANPGSGASLFERAAPVPGDSHAALPPDDGLFARDVDTTPPVSSDSLASAGTPPAPTDNLAVFTPGDGLFDSAAGTPPVPADSLPALTPGDSLFERAAGTSPVPTDSQPTLAESDVPTDSLAALAELDALLAGPGPLADLACTRLAALALQAPGRQRAVTAALARTASTAAIAALRGLPSATPGLLEALVACFTRGRPRLEPVPGDMPAPLLALEFRGSRARGFPDLVARAQAIAATCPAAEFAALDLDARRHYRLTFWPDRSPTAALAVQLRAAVPDLAWLHGRLVRLRGSRLWLAGWRFDADDPLGPAAQARLLHVWLHGWLDRAREPAK